MHPNKKALTPEVLAEQRAELALDLMATLDEMSKGLDTSAAICQACGHRTYHNFADFKMEQAIIGMQERVQTMYRNSLRAAGGDA